LTGGLRRTDRRSAVRSPSARKTCPLTGRCGTLVIEYFESADK
jgi:hypothetical protein